MIRFDINFLIETKCLLEYNVKYIKVQLILCRVIARNIFNEG